MWKRFLLREHSRDSGREGISSQPELCVTFLEWLKANELEGLARFFEMPITTDLDEIPAPYALRYGSILSVLSFLLSATKFARFLPAPLLVRRF